MKYPNSLSTQSRLILNLTGSPKNSIYLSDKRVWSPGSNVLNRNVMKKIIHYLEREEELCSHSFFETVLIKSSMHRPGAGLHFSKVWFRSKERLSHIPPSNCGLQTDLSIRFNWRPEQDSWLSTAEAVHRAWVNRNLDTLWKTLPSVYCFIHFICFI